MTTQTRKSRRSRKEPNRNDSNSGAVRVTGIPCKAPDSTTPPPHNIPPPTATSTTTYPTTPPPRAPHSWPPPHPYTVCVPPPRAKVDDIIDMKQMTKSQLAALPADGGLDKGAKKDPLAKQRHVTSYRSGRVL